MRTDARGRGWVPLTAGLLTAAIGIFDVVSALQPELRSRLQALTTVVPGALSHAASAATVVTGVLLVVLAHGLRRRKRRAWRAAVVLLVGSVLFHVVRGLEIEAAAVAAVLAGALAALQAHFYAAGDPRTRWRAVGAFVALSAASLGIGLAITYVRDEAVLGTPDFTTRLSEVLHGMVGLNGPLVYASDRVGDLVGDVLLGLGIMTAFATVYLALRPAEPVARLDTEAELHLRDLLRRHGGCDSLGYFALRRDKSVVFSPTGKAAVSYRVVSGVMLASGDPIGDPEAWPGAIREFMALADRHAWVPAVMGCSERGGEVWVREAGLRALELGDEAIVDVDGFSLEGRAMRNVRQMANRVERAGYSARVRRIGDMSTEEIEQVRAQAAAWRGAEVERGFSMALGRFGDPADADAVAVTAHLDGELRAVLHFVPWGDDGLSLDLMRRDRAADPGLNEFLIVKALQLAPSLGVRRLSLNFAVFRAALARGERLGAGPVLRSWRALLLFASRWFQIESLYRFNAKFRPEWEPRFVCYPGARALPRVAVAALEAEAFLVWPRLPFTRRWLPSGSVPVHHHAEVAP